MGSILIAQNKQPAQALQSNSQLPDLIHRAERQRDGPRHTPPRSHAPRGNDCQTLRVVHTHNCRRAAGFSYPRRAWVRGRAFKPLQSHDLETARSLQGWGFRLLIALWLLRTNRRSTSGSNTANSVGPPLRRSLTIAVISRSAKFQTILEDNRVAIVECTVFNQYNRVDSRSS